MKKLIEELKNFEEGMFFEEGATIEQIDNFEKENDITLPQDYKEWLLFSNGGEIFAPDYIFFGVPSSKYSGVCINSPDYRFEEMPENLCIIGLLSFGDVFCIDTENMNVVQWNHEENEVECVWENFHELLDEIIEDGKENYFI